MRLVGAIVRALMVVTVVAMPSLLLPSSSQGAVEFSLIVGGIIGVFTIFEYVSSSPGFVDFRFAPPYNRFRAFTIAMQVAVVTLICRSIELGLLESETLELARQAALRLDFAYSPVAEAIDVVLRDATFADTTAIMMVYSVTASFTVGIGLTLFFAFLLWLFSWPADRENFNLWANLPTFQPAEGKSVTKRLSRDAYFNIALAIILIYALPYLPKYGFDWLTVDLLESSQAMVWGATLWVFIPTSLIARAFAILKIVRIIKRANR